ncbi:MAG: DinB family protein [Candidatus Heimdallarchaeota archaeon]|nr:DinB family protein [Candidatus Heimdallarchaeota archaeon]
MKDFELIKSNYLKVRASIIKYLEKFDDDRYFYQPTEKSNSTAWIVPHIVAFEKVMVTDHIENYDFASFISTEDVEKYKPGVNGFAFTKKQMLTKEQAIELLTKVQDVSMQFLDDMINESEAISEVDAEIAFSKYLLNFSHEMEHFGQLKYLLGTYNRTHP